MIYLLAGYGLFVVVILLMIGGIGMRFKGSLAAAPLPVNPPKVSTIVPARNEERNIGRCAAGITGQDYENLEMVFVDDASEDTTPAILGRFSAQDARVKVINTGGKPDGWNGKQWACHCGAEAASGDWLCFMDADTYAEPDLITRTLAFAEANQIDMLTLQPWYEMQGLWERIVMPAGLPSLLLIFPPDNVNNPNKKLAMANGQFILIRTSAYHAVGGHEAVRDCMMDDFSLAEIVKGQGFRLFVADGMDVMRVRMYRNLREIRNGALKAAVEISGGWLSSVLALIVNTIVNVLPPFLLIWAVLADKQQASVILGLIVGFQLVFNGVVRMTGFRAPPWTAVTYPLGTLMVNAILLDGMLHVATNSEIKWKDRPVMGAPQLERPLKPLDDPE